MRKASINTLINYSLERTALILFKPFSLKKWLCLLFIAWLSGALGGGVNFSSNHNDIFRKKADAAQMMRHIGMQSSTLSNKQELRLRLASAYKRIFRSKKPPVLTGGVILALILGLLLCASMLLFLWLSSRFKFIWFKAIVADDASIAGPFKEYCKEGNSLFLVYLLLLAAMFVFICLIGVWVFAVGKATGVFATETDWSLPNIFGTFFIPGAFLLVGLVAFAVLRVYIDHFVVTIMALDGSRFKAAWRRFVELFKQNAGDFLSYVLVLIGLGIASGVAIFLLMLLCIVVLALLAGLVFGITYLFIGVFLKAKVLYLILAVLFAIPFLAITVLLLLAVALPFAVFFRSFSLFFLSSLESGYVPLPLASMANSNVS